MLDKSAVIQVAATIKRVICRFSGIIAESSTDGFKEVDIMKGIDVSVHNGNIDWNRVRNAGIAFAILRAGYGRVASQKGFNGFPASIPVQDVPAAEPVTDNKMAAVVLQIGDDIYKGTLTKA